MNKNIQLNSQNNTNENQTLPIKIIERIVYYKDILNEVNDESLECTLEYFLKNDDMEEVLRKWEEVAKIFKESEKRMHFIGPCLEKRKLYETIVKYTFGDNSYNVKKSKV